MALSITSNYAGDVSAAIAHQLITGNEAFDQGLIHITTTKKVMNIRRISSTTAPQAYAATPTSSGTTTFNEKQLSVTKINVYEEFNPFDFDDYWAPPTGHSQLVFKQLAPELQVEMVNEILRRQRNWWGKNIWQADTAGSAPDNLFDGFLKNLNGDGTVIDVSTPVTLTAGNIKTELDRVRALVPAAVWNHPDFKIVWSHKSGQLYGEAEESQTYKGRDFTNAGASMYWNKPIHSLSGMADDKIIAGVFSTTTDGNFWFGVENESDSDMVKVQPLQNNSDLYFIKMTLKVGVQTRWGNEIVAYNA